MKPKQVDAGQVIHAAPDDGRTGDAMYSTLVDDKSRLRRAAALRGKVGRWAGHAIAKLPGAATVRILQDSPASGCMREICWEFWTAQSSFRRERAHGALGAKRVVVETGTLNANSIPEQ